MKALVTLLFASCSLVASAQAVTTGYAALPKDSTTQKIVYTAVIQAAGVSKADLFSRAQDWGARTFVDSKAASRIIDKEAGTLVYHSFFYGKSGSLTGREVYGFSVGIYTKEGRYKYVIDQLTDKPSIRGNDPTLPIEQLHTYGNHRFVDKRAAEIDTAVKSLIVDLTAAMSAKASAVSKDF